MARGYRRDEDDEDFYLDEEEELDERLDGDDQDDEDEDEDLSEEEQKLLNKMRSRLGREARQIGMGIGEYLQQQQGKSAKQETPAEEEAEEDDDEDDLGDIPDPVAEPDEYRKWQRARDKKVAERAASMAIRQLAPVVGRVVDRDLDEAVDVAFDALGRYRMGHLLDHPDFEKKLRESLPKSGLPVGKWTDPKELAKIAGFLAPDLLDSQPRRKNRDSEPRSRDRDERSVRSSVSRDGYRSIAATRGGGGGGGRESRQDRDQARVEQLYAKRLGTDVEEVRALGDEYGEDLHDLRQRRASGKDRGGNARRGNAR